MPLICAARVHIMNLSYSTPGECKQLKNKGWESVYLEGFATQIFWIRQTWTSCYWRNIQFSSKCGFQTMWIGRAGRWLCPGDVPVNCHVSPKHFQGIITLWFLSFRSLPGSPTRLQYLRDCDEAKASAGSWHGALWGRVPALLMPSSDWGSRSQHHCGTHQKAVGLQQHW